MITDTGLSANVTNEQIKKLRDFMMFYLDSTDDKGNIDLEKIIHNSTYNMGEAIVQINGLIFQEKIKLENYEDMYRKKRKELYENTMNTRYAWTPTSKGVEIMVDGDENMSGIKSKMEKQRLYVEFLTQCQEAMRYYPRNVDCLVHAVNTCVEFGKLVIKDGKMVFV